MTWGLGVRRGLEVASPWGALGLAPGRADKGTLSAPFFQASADSLYLAHSGRPFNSLEPTRCLMGFLRLLTYNDDGGRGAEEAATTVDAPMSPPPNVTMLMDIEMSDPELPQCVVSKQ